MTNLTAQQLDDYLSFNEASILIKKDEAKKETCLGYWRNKRERFPDLAKVARKYLSAPCTSTDSERLFSAASDVLNEKRNRLACHKAERLLFVKKNISHYFKQ